jgi:hypothetical protein
MIDWRDIAQQKVARGDCRSASTEPAHVPSTPLGAGFETYGLGFRSLRTSYEVRGDGRATSHHFAGANLPFYFLFQSFVFPRLQCSFPLTLSGTMCSRHESSFPGPPLHTTVGASDRPHHPFYIYTTSAWIVLCATLGGLAPIIRSPQGVCFSTQPAFAVRIGLRDRCDVL